MWRPEDDALLRRVEDELLLDVVWQAQAGAPRSASAEAPTDRAGGMFELVRASEEGHRLLAQALTGRAGPLVAWLESSPVEAHPPALLHHLGLYFERLGRVLEGVKVESSASAYLRSLACFLALGAEREYLAALARRILGPQAKNVDPERSSQAFVLSRIDELGARAELGANAQAGVAGRAALDASKAAMVALAQGERAVAMAALPAPYREPIVRHLSRVRASAVDSALQRLTEELDAATARNATAEARFHILLGAVAVWAWSYYDETVETFALERAEPLAWELRRAKSWKALRTLYVQLRPLVQTLASRIEADRSKVAWAALAAQGFVFLADCSEVLSEQILLCERALVVCPNHPNAKSVLAWYLATDALQRLESGLPAGAALDEIRAIYARAKAMDPDDARVKKLAERLALSPGGG